MKRGDVVYLHMSSWAGCFAYPVELLSLGPKRAKVRARHKMRFVGSKRDYPAGTERTVPSDALGASPWAGYYVSQGGGRFRPQ